MHIIWNAGHGNIKGAYRKHILLIKRSLGSRNWVCHPDTTSGQKHSFSYLPREHCPRLCPLLRVNPNPVTGQYTGTKIWPLASTWETEGPDSPRVLCGVSWGLCCKSCLWPILPFMPISSCSWEHLPVTCLHANFHHRELFQASMWAVSSLFTKIHCFLHMEL